MQKLEGTVVKGRGAGLKYPTATLYMSGSYEMPHGVYVSEVRISKDKNVYRGATSVGVASTVDAKDVTCETYVIGLDRDVTGCRMEIRLLHFIRPMRHFSSIEELELAIGEDIAISKDF